MSASGDNADCGDIDRAMNDEQRKDVKPALHAAVWMVPAGMLALALLPFPYGYYVLLRWVVTVAAMVIVLMSPGQAFASGWKICLIVVALLFNPLIPVHLRRDAWAVIDLLVAGVFVAHWWAHRARSESGDS